MNTMLGRRVYFQIIFSQFDPEVSSNNCNISDYIINKKREFGGHTRTGSPVCTIKTYKLFEGLIQGWGMEDVDLHQKFVNHKDIDVFRARVFEQPTRACYMFIIRSNAIQNFRPSDSLNVKTQEHR